MAVKVQIETTIERAPSEVFEELAAVERYPSWMVASGVTAVDGPGLTLTEGSRIRIHQTVAGRSTVLAGSVDKFEPSRAIGLTGRDPEGVSVAIEATLSPAGTATRVRWSLRLDLPLRYRMFEAMVTPQVKRAAALDLDALKRRLERTAGSGR
jgi:uncharacterized protein YndB with AHSA1/START domain